MGVLISGSSRPVLWRDYNGRYHKGEELVEISVSGRTRGTYVVHVTTESLKREVPGRKALQERGIDVPSEGIKKFRNSFAIEELLRTGLVG